MAKDIKFNIDATVVRLCWKIIVLGRFEECYQRGKRIDLKRGIDKAVAKC